MSEHPGPHILSRFDHDLEALRTRVASMAAIVRSSLASAQAGLIGQDVEKCNMVIADSEEIDGLERGISAEATSLIMRFQPVAQDLRLVISTIKVSGNLERIGDHVVGIARRSRKAQGWPDIPEKETLRAIFSDAGKFVDQVMAAFLERNPLSLNLMEPAYASLTGRIHNYGDIVTLRISYELGQGVIACVDLIHIAKHLEQLLSISRAIGLDTHFAIHPDAVLRPVNREQEPEA